MRLRRGFAALVTAAALVAVAAPGVAQGVTQGATSDSQPSVVGLRSSDGASVVGEKWLDARTVDLRMSAPQVWAEPIPVRVILPVGYSASGKSYPVVFLLHGANDDYTSWTRETDIEPLSAGYDAIVVMPGAGNNATYTNYFRPYNGNRLQWGTFHTVELPQILEQGFHTNRNRAIAGLSSGGYGAFAYATQNPGMFKYAASYSGPIAIRLPLVRTGMLALAFDLNPYARWGVPLLDEKNWIKNDPLSMAANLRGTGVYLSTGTTGLPSQQDTEGWNPAQISEAVIGTIGASFSSRLQQLKIPATTHFYTLGEHDWVAWQRELHTSYPLMMTAIKASEL